MRLRIGERREASLAREGKDTCRLRTPFYGAAARLRFRTTKTQRSPRLCGPVAMQQLRHRQRVAKGTMNSFGAHGAPTSLMRVNGTIAGPRSIYRNLR
jgi:hypothetical protein